MTCEEIRALIAKGYRRTSNAYGIVSRVDRPDWRECMAKHHCPWDPSGEGMRWARVSGNADYYRRVLSKDRLELGPNIARHVPNSTHDAVGYVS